MSAGTWIKRHWRGDLPLAVSFWGVGGLLVLGTRALGKTRMWESSLFLDIHIDLVVDLVDYGLQLAGWVWWCVGTWRCASRRIRIGERLWRARSTKVAVGVVTSLILYIWAASALTVIGDTLSNISGDTRLRQNGVRVIADGRELEVYGTITRTVSRVLDKAIEYGPPVVRIRFNSLGGRADAAFEIKRIIEAHGLDTLVEKECTSACVFAFLGGKHRWAAPQARMGFHRVASYGQDDRASTDTVRQILMEAGVAPGFLAKAFSTPPTSVWYPSLDELLAAGVITGIARDGDVDRKESDNGSTPAR